MDKKDIYEHLAKIYLDSTHVKRKRSRSRSKDYRTPALIAASSLLVILILATTFWPRAQKLTSSETQLILNPDIAKINYQFDPVKKEMHNFDLKKLNLSKYKTLAFSLKKSNFNDIVALRVEFTNIYKERSELYLNDISNHWQEFKLNLSDFKAISDWSEMETLSFIVEEWNSKEGKGILFVDNVRVMK